MTVQVPISASKSFSALSISASQSLSVLPMVMSSSVGAWAPELSKVGTEPAGRTSDAVAAPWELAERSPSVGGATATLTAPGDPKAEDRTEFAV